MGTMNISLPDALRTFVEERVANGGYNSSGEYVRELIRRELDRTRVRGLLLEGAASTPAITAEQVSRAAADRVRSEALGLFLERWEEENGPITDEELDDAREEMGWPRKNPKKGSP
jgi:antitoxin ParD1/3/4